MSAKKIVIGIKINPRVHKMTCARLGKPGPTGFKACDCGAEKEAK